jgi:hypothetical protein
LKAQKARKLEIKPDKEARRWGEVQQCNPLDQHRLTGGSCAQAESGGTYATEYRTNTAGTYDLRGRAGSSPLASQYTVHVAPGQLKASNCLWHIAGWTAGGYVQAGSVLSVEIMARDKGAASPLNQNLLSTEYAELPLLGETVAPFLFLPSVFEANMKQSLFRCCTH